MCVCVCVCVSFFFGEDETGHPPIMGSQFDWTCPLIIFHNQESKSEWSYGNGAIQGWWLPWSWFADRLTRIYFQTPCWLGTMFGQHETQHPFFGCWGSIDLFELGMIKSYSIEIYWNDFSRCWCQMTAGGSWLQVRWWNALSSLLLCLLVRGTRDFPRSPMCFFSRFGKGKHGNKQWLQKAPTY